MPHAAPLVATIASAFVMAFVFGTLAQRLRVPPLVGYLLAGVLVGPFTPGLVADTAIAGQLAEIGVILLMFGVGLGLDHRGKLRVPAEHELDRGIGQRRRFLRDAGDAHAAGQVDVALVGFDLAEDGREQARLAAAVAPDHAHAPAGVQGQVDVGQQEAFAATKGEIAEGEHAGSREKRGAF